MVRESWWVIRGPPLMLLAGGGEIFHLFFFPSGFFPLLEKGLNEHFLGLLLSPRFSMNACRLIGGPRQRKGLTISCVDYMGGHFYINKHLYSAEQ